MTKRIGVIACSKRKLTEPARARYLYRGQLFRLAVEVVEATCDTWCILSAKYGLVLPDALIGPYDETLRTMPIRERRAWAARTKAELIAEFPGAHFVVYAGSNYRQALQGLDYEAPLEGLSMGKQVQKLLCQVSEIQGEEDDDPHLDQIDALDVAISNCHQLSNGICMAAGSEYCDWECPLRDR